MATFTAQPCGVFSVSPIVRSDDFGAETFGLSAGAGVAFLIHCTDANILSLDEAASTVERFEDDQGTDLRTGPDDPFAGFPRQGVSSQTGPSPHDDPHGVVVQVATHAAPAAAATRLRVDATAHLVIAAQRSTADLPFASIAVGPLAVGDLSIAVEATGASVITTNAPFVIRFRAPVGDQRRLLDLRFFDVDGNAIQFSRQSLPPFEVFECVFDAVLESVAMQFEFWDGVSQETVALAADVTLGFA